MLISFGFEKITQQENPNKKILLLILKNISSIIAGITHARQMEKCNSDVIKNLCIFLKEINSVDLLSNLISHR